ncbi:tyrosine-protein kinase domain-containing protein [Chroococcus sp. FPU101]|uniref:GumC family protein n=1 Tax=Chroococcus sp. FPU101 TaxID=1974212 RepID=UPI001A8C214E|nr:tyrosine-protein kinase domain-containing protein [Chroococcus sp. FPU101]GFE68221.1 capsular exopolysaccharide family protein [Chroococcus sp. FPU101]
MATQNNYDVSPETSGGYGQLLGILWYRRFWFLLTFISTFIALIPFAFREKPTYQSSMQLLVEPNYQDNSSQNSIKNFTDTTIQVDYATQLSLMRSSELIQKAVEILKPEYPTINIDEIKNSLVLTQVIENEKPTKIFRADYISDDPQKAQKILSTIQKVYRDYNLNQQKQRLVNGLSFVEEQLQTARKDLSESETRLKKFRSQNNLIEPETEANLVTQNLVAIEQSLRATNSEKREAEVAYNQLKSNFKSSSMTNLLNFARLSQSSKYQNLLNQMFQIEVSIAEQSAKLTNANPIMEELLEKRQKLDQLLVQEKNNLIGTTLNQSTKNAQVQQLSPQDLALVNQLMALQTQLSVLAVRSQNLEKRKQELKAEINDFPGLITEYKSIVQQAEFRRSVVQQLLQVQQQLGVELNRGGFNWQVVESPQLGYKLGPNIKKKLLFNGIVALFLGGMAAFLRESMDDAVHSADQLKQQEVLPLLGVTPKWQTLTSRFNVSLPRGVPSESPLPTLDIFLWQPFRESLDYIYQNIQLLNAGASQTSLVITSSVAGEGKSTLTLGLAFSASRLHQRVLVIDANLRSPTLHQYFELPNDKGLSTLLVSRIEPVVPHTVHLVDIEIDLLTAGPSPQDPVRLLASRSLKELVQSFEQNYDLILLDTPAILGGVDAIQIASCAKGVIMVGRLDQVTQAELAESITLLSKLTPVGIVANGARSLINNNLPASERESLSLLRAFNNNN